mmetsp:Transcript_2291/g.4439  ORF Transcript_2291/g.4439 Transcript_2291/m.4439 type:complete len:246 (-) Transcript_2291:60-797(-)
MDRLVEWIRSNCDNDKHRTLWKESACVRMQVDPSSECGDRVLMSVGEMKRNLRLPIPPKCIIMLDKVKKMPVGVALEGLDDYSIMATFLLYEKRLGEESFWQPYINVLPTDMGFHPITFIPRVNKDKALDKALSEEPLLLKALQAQDQKLRSEYKSVTAQIKTHEKNLSAFSSNLPTYEEFIWANCMVISRAFNMSEPKVMVMLPFADSMNHSMTPTVQWRPKLPRGFFVITIIEDTPPGVGKFK